jgi:hypothetical protein
VKGKTAWGLPAELGAWTQLIAILLPARGTAAAGQNWLFDSLAPVALNNLAQNWVDEHPKSISKQLLIDESGLARLRR